MFAPWKKYHDNPRQHVKKQRQHFANKGLYSQSYSCSSNHVQMWDLDLKEDWEPKNWCFWIVVWRRLLRVPWIARISNQSILKEISLEYSLEGLILKLKLQYFGHLMWRANSLEKTLMLGKIESKGKRGQQRMRWFDSIINWIDLNLSKLQEIVKDRGAWCAAVHGFTKSPTRQWLNNNNKDNFIKSVFCCLSLHKIVCLLVDNLNTA